LVDKLMKKSYYDDNDGKILLVINGENIYYQIFSVYVAKSNNYTDRNFDDLEKTLKELKSRSSIKFDNDLEGVEQILTLSTCHDNNKDRLVVHAYKKMS